MGIAPLLTLAGGLVGSFGQYQAGQYQAQQSARAAQVARVQADQTDAAYRDELNSTISNIRAVRAASGAGAMSPTGMAIEANQQRISDRDRKIEVGNKRMQAAQSESDARIQRSSAKWSLLGGTATSFGTAFNKTSLSNFFGS